MAEVARTLRALRDDERRDIEVVSAWVPETDEVSARREGRLKLRREHPRMHLGAVVYVQEMSLDGADGHEVMVEVLP